MKPMIFLIWKYCPIRFIYFIFFHAKAAARCTIDVYNCKKMYNNCLDFWKFLYRVVVGYFLEIDASLFVSLGADQLIHRTVRVKIELLTSGSLRLFTRQGMSPGFIKIFFRQKKRNLLLPNFSFCRSCSEKICEKQILSFQKGLQEPA